MQLQQVHFWQKTCSSGRLRCSWQALARHDRSTAQRVGIVHPEPGWRPPGRRFVLHRTSGPRPCTLHVGMSALERGLLLLLRACTPPSRALPQPAPPPQPWPPSGVHFHPSDPPFGRSCIVSALSVCPVCRRREAASAAVAAARAAGRAAGAAGSMAAAWAAAEAAVWPPGWAMAAARAPVRASPAAFRSSSRAAAAAALEAAAAVVSRPWRPGRRLQGVRSREAAGGARRRRGDKWSRVGTRGIYQSHLHEYADDV